MIYVDKNTVLQGTWGKGIILCVEGYVSYIERKN